MGLSGRFTAECKVCGSIFIWHLDHAPFTDSKIIGTCPCCTQKVNHTIVDETNFLSRAIGKIEFRKDGAYITHYEGDFAGIPFRIKTKT